MGDVRKIVCLRPNAGNDILLNGEMFESHAIAFKPSHAQLVWFEIGLIGNR
jgi:hypothetical protein